jgi:hypothetical protein
LPFLRRREVACPATLVRAIVGCASLMAAFGLFAITFSWPRLQPFTYAWAGSTFRFPAEMARVARPLQPQSKRSFKFFCPTSTDAANLTASLRVQIP